MAASTGSRPSPVRKFLRILAALVAIGIVGFWFAKDGRTGWSQDRVPVNQKDEITGIDYVTYEERFVPGIDTLGAGLGVAAALFVLSFFFRSKHPN
ncbi:hypothetical protein [Oleiharenicola lentus]|uniref:hypothetical protein n=1 Tax=Oleiharenicola lentus TaxID=2508720 RepID=UPI003F6675CF